MNKQIKQINKYNKYKLQLIECKKITECDAQIPNYILLHAYSYLSLAPGRQLENMPR